MRANFGPSFIKRPLGMSLGANAVSELQPMNPEDRKVGVACLCVLYRYMLVGLCICLRVCVVLILNALYLYLHYISIHVIMVRIV